MRLLGLVVVASCLAAPVSAQTGWFTLPVPAASLTQLDVSHDQGRALVLLRVIRLLHSNPRAGDPPPHVVEFERSLADLDAVEQELQRMSARGLSLAMATNSGERDVLGDVLDTMGLHLRERRGAYMVEASRDGDAVKRRTRLDAAGFDTAAIEKALNAGETVRPARHDVELPMPLPHEAWESAIFERTVPARSLFSAIVRDRRASLLFYGLSAMTPETRAHVARDRELLQRLYRDLSGTVAAFGGSFRVGADGRVIVPGGADAVELWEALAEERLEPAGRFARALFSRSGGRLAYLFDAVAHLDAPHQRFALGLWITDRRLRLERLRALFRAFAEVDSMWLPADRPFARPLYDPSNMLALVDVAVTGDPAAPRYVRFWDRALASAEVPAAGARELKNLAEDGVVDAPWLAEHLLQGLSPERGARLGCFAFGQRVFGGERDEELDDVLVAIRACSRFPALVMTLERAGIRRPATYAAAARRALEIEGIGDPAQSVPVLTQFQGALVLLERMSRTGAVTAPAVDDLVASLCAIPVKDGGYGGAVAVWLETALLPPLPAAAAGSERPVEARVLRALADTAARTAFEWEGGQHVVDVTGVAVRDLAAVRAKQGGNTLDTLIALTRALASLEQNALTIDVVKTQTAALTLAAAALHAARAWPDSVDSVPDVRKTADRVLHDLQKIQKPKDVAKAARIVAPLTGVAGYLLGETLVALAYAPHLGDPRDLLGPESDESHRHSFGFSVKTGSVPAARRAWLRPALDTAARSGRALSGGLFGLDLALSPKRLRRLAPDGLPRPPRLGANDRAALVDVLALMNPRTLTEEDLAAIGMAIARGREQVRHATNVAALAGLADRVSMSDSRKALLAWTLSQEPARVPALFSTAEMFWLGQDGQPFPRLDAWGTSFEPQSGCYCLRFPPAGTWDRVAGRLGGRLLGAALPDLTLRVAEHMAALNAPVSLLPAVMAFATQDFIDGAPPLFDDDWMGIVGYAGQLSRETVQDYVAAVVAAGPVRDATREAQR